MTAHHPARHVDAVEAPEQDRRAALWRADRIVRQVLAVDAWIAARREREQALRAPGRSRDERLHADREVDALRRTHDTIKGCCARGLDVEMEPFRRPGLTAVVAHRPLGSRRSSPCTSGRSASRCWRAWRTARRPSA
jgi:hypothetical protein